MSTLLGWFVYFVVLAACLCVPARLAESTNPVIRRIGSNPFFILAAFFGCTILAMLIANELGFTISSGEYFEGYESRGVGPFEY